MKNIKSLSISVPAAGCVNDCKFCVSKMKDDWKCFGTTDEYLTEEAIRNAINAGIKAGIKSVIITGTVEPLQNMKIVQRICKVFREIDPADVSLEIQTSLCYGAMTTPYIKKLNDWGVDVVAVSIASFNDETNYKIMGIPVSRWHSIYDAFDYINCTDMTLRVCINVSDMTFSKRMFYFGDTLEEQILEEIQSLGANQITIRRLYNDGSDTPQAKWIKEHELSEDFWSGFKNTLSEICVPVNSIDWLLDGYKHIRIDEDCMGKQDESRYWVLRPDGKIYLGWDATEPIEM